MKDRMTGRPRGFGFITYADPSVVDTVIVETHVIDDKQVSVMFIFCFLRSLFWCLIVYAPLCFGWYLLLSCQ